MSFVGGIKTGFCGMMRIDGHSYVILSAKHRRISFITIICCFDFRSQLFHADCVDYADAQSNCLNYFLNIVRSRRIFFYYNNLLS